MKLSSDLRVGPKACYEAIKQDFDLTFYDIYLTAGVVGYTRGIKNSNYIKMDEYVTIPRSILNNNLSELNYYHEIVFLADKQYDIDENEWIQLAFEDNNDNEKTFDNLEKVKLFNSYAYEGVQYLYDKIFNDSRARIDTLDSLISDLLAEIEG